jgi:NADH-quinone oxidoreductase subunit C
MTLSPKDIAARLVERFGNRIHDVIVDDKHPRVHVDASHWREVAEFLKYDPALKFDWLSCLSGIDYAADDRLAVVADLWSYDHKHEFAVKVYVGRGVAKVPSVADLWPAANWHEREAFDLVGIEFIGHPNLTRILLADDWVGHPLQKDYVFPRQVNGIPGSVELDWQQKPEPKK